MARRFNNLKAALKLLRPLSGGGDAPDLPDTTALGFYQAVAAGKRQVTYGDRPENSRQGSIKKVAVLPFALTESDDKYAVTGVSNRAVTTTNLANASISKGVLGYEDSGTNFDEALRLQGFTPAQATIRVLGNATSSPTSKLTGRRYKKREAVSYTYPFGLLSNARTAGFQARKSAITTAVQQKTTARVSFSPERF